MGKEIFRVHVAAVVDLLWPPLCPRCGERATFPRDRFCEACWRSLRPLDRAGGQGALAAFAVDSLFLEVLATAKYRRYRGVCRRLASEAACRIAPWVPDGPLVPVPLARAKLRERGFNQSLELAEALAARTGSAIARDWLVRVRGGRALAGRAREDRALAVRGAFAPGPGLVAGGVRPIVLVDDIVTTGATSADCTRALRKAGVTAPIVVAAMGRAFASARDRPPASREALGRL